MIDPAALVERVADLVRFNHDPIAIANEAIDLIRADVLEEAARELDRWGDIYGDNAAAAIRALKGDTCSSL
jgi:hypothetical protein